MTEVQVTDIVNWALAENESLVIQGKGTKRHFGYSTDVDSVISLDEIKGILSYEPSELAMKALPGTPLDEIEHVLAEHDQHLSFEPMKLGYLYHGTDTSGTIGGVFMGNLSGPRRFRAGAARDHILGIKAVSGRGQAYKSGGMVIKNVTGYDMSKLLTGSWGTLSIVTELSFKVLPMAKYSQSICIVNQEPEAALSIIHDLAQSPYDINGLAFLPGFISKNCDLNIGFKTDSSLTLIRLEGSEASVKERVVTIQKLILSSLEVKYVSQENSIKIWEKIRDVSFFSATDSLAIILKLSVPPSSGIDIIKVLDSSEHCNWYLDAAGGWIWVSLKEDDAEKMIRSIRKILSLHGGSAVLYSATDNIKKNAGIFSQMPKAVATLNRQIKENFDPKNILNPGRLYNVSREA